MSTRGPQARGWGRGMRVFLAVDAALVLVLLVLIGVWVAGSGGSGPSATPTPAPTGAAQGTPGPQETPASTTPTSFRMPSGNIACTLSVDGVTCTIASIRFEPPVVGGCTGQTGHVFVLNADGVTVPCVDGAAPSVADDSVATLQYGSSTAVGDYTCTSGTDGVTCLTAEGIGFRLASGSWNQPALIQVRRRAWHDGGRGTTRAAPHQPQERP
ncbi:hypothetical protein [Cellulomonas soli]